MTSKECYSYLLRKEQSPIMVTYDVWPRPDTTLFYFSSLYMLSSYKATWYLLCKYVFLRLGYVLLFVQKQSSYLSRNEARKLTPNEKRAKLIKKNTEDTSVKCRVQVYRFGGGGAAHGRRASYHFLDHFHTCELSFSMQ